MRKLQTLFAVSILALAPMGFVACGDEEAPGPDGGGGDDSGTGGGDNTGGNGSGGRDNTGGTGNMGGGGGMVNVDELYTTADCLAVGGPNEKVTGSELGAFEGGAEWLEGWVNWNTDRDADGVSTAAPNVTVNADITADTTWTKDNVYLLQGKVHVTNDATLTIEPGTVIKGDQLSVGTLIVSRDGRLVAEGTKEEPIVFTANKPNGGKAAGQWGGVILLGSAPHFKGNAVEIEGLPGDPLATYGGTDDEHDCGSLRYVRIEFGGNEVQPNKEINGLTLGSCGTGTSISYVQVNSNQDDCFEWFGGAGDADHLVCTSGGDDMLDADLGFRGTISYFFGRQRVLSSNDPSGLEWDGDRDLDPVNGQPVSTTVNLENATICGLGNFEAGVPNYGAVFRETMRGSVTKTVWTGFDVAIDTRNVSEDEDGPLMTITNSGSLDQGELFPAYEEEGDGNGNEGTCSTEGADVLLCDDDGGFDELSLFLDGDGNVDYDAL